MGFQGKKYQKEGKEGGGSQSGTEHNKSREIQKDRKTREKIKGKEKRGKGKEKTRKREKEDKKSERVRSNSSCRSHESGDDYLGFISST